jgi:uncharacterized protein YcsI (UPF0317 family)
VRVRFGGAKEYTTMASRVSTENVADLNPREVRSLIGRGEWTRSTVGLAPGYLQANLAVVPKDHAFDFLLFCARNPKPCAVC